MQGVAVKKTYPSDFEKVYPLLQEFDSPHTDDDWSRIFSYRWDGALDYVGFHLEHNNQVVGFMGLIFSHRYKNNHRYTFCNITSLIVKEGYRAATLLLVRKLQSFKDVIFTGLGPIDESYRLLTMIGFEAYEKAYKIVPTVNHLFSRKCKVKVYETPILLDKADNESKRIVNDHRGLRCQSVLFNFNGENCLVLYKISKQRYFKILVKKVHILYIGDVPLFNENIYAVLCFFRKRFGFLSAIYLDSRFLDDRHFLFAITRKVAPPKICKNPYHNEVDIDELYSEVVLL